MKLYWNRGDYDWQPERYKYSVEQMMLTPLPPESGPSTLEESAGAGEDWATFCRHTGREGGHRHGPGGAGGPPGPGPRPFSQGETGRARRKGVSYCPARTEDGVLPRGSDPCWARSPPWGALTGVRPVKLPTGRCWRAPHPGRPSWEPGAGLLCLPRHGPLWR